MQSQNHILKLLLSWSLGYIRWTQLTPMFLLWGFSLLMLLALTFVNFQVQTISALELFMEWLMQIPIAGERITLLLSDKNTNTQMNTSDLKSFVLSTWALLSLALTLAGMVLSSLFGPFQSWALKRKILIVGAGVVMLLIGMIMNYYIAPQNYNGEASAWILNFSLIALLVFVVSAYCLSISHFLGYLNEALMADIPKRSDNSGGVQ